MGKTFVFGIGAQKSGTSWLSNYLRSFDSADFGFTKEYHIWDAICTDAFADKKINAVPALRNWKKFVRRRMQKNSSYYFDYFSRKLERPNIFLSGDITPEYAALSTDVFQHIDQQFRNRGVRVKFIFLIRDPVKRCWSAFPGHLMKNNIDIDSCDPRYQEYFLEFVEQADTQLRTRYDRTLENLYNAVDESQVYVGIYEDMFFNKKIEPLSQFVNIQPNYAFLERKFNTARRCAVLSDETAATAAEHNRDVYAWCRQHFPQTEALWSGYQYV